ncbi:MAG: thermonuclease family protein [Pseudomonadota bacterium]
MARRNKNPVPIKFGKVYRAQARKREQAKRVRFAFMLAGFTGAGALLGLAGLAAMGSFNRDGTAQAAEASYDFAVCGMVRRTCVVDGDTFWLEGVKVRVADIDTPEISEPRCDAEYALGIRARDRFTELLNEGPFTLAPVGTRDEDQYGRKLRVVVRDGVSLGDLLVGEGLARTWTGRREPWC